MRDIHETAAIVRNQNARNVERASRRRKNTRPQILKTVTAAAMLEVIFLAANMRYSLGEIIAFCGCVGWVGLFLLANKEKTPEAATPGANVMK